MLKRKILPIVAGLGIVFALAVALTPQSKTLPLPPAAEPSQAPYENYVGGAGMVEASTENINIGTPLPGIAKRVYVKVGQKVRPGDPLFEIDDREYWADFEIRQGNLMKAEAAVVEARASLQDAEDQYELVKNIADSRAVSFDDVRKRHDAMLLAEAKVSSAKAAAFATEAEVRAARTNLDRLMVRSPIEGEILQVTIHPGEYVPAGGSATPPIRMGNLDTLHVRVDIDENDAWRFKPDTKAIAFIRGNRDLKVDLAFVRVEPYITPKTSLTGSSTERVDTRVLQILYRFERAKLPVFVGQQVDVYIDTNADTGRKTLPRLPSRVEVRTNEKGSSPHRGRPSSALQLRFRGPRLPETRSCTAKRMERIEAGRASSRANPCTLGLVEEPQRPYPGQSHYGGRQYQPRSQRSPLPHP